MKKTFIAFALVFGFQLSADDHLPANYSMYQANFLFNCPVAEKCFAAFDKYMNSPEVAKENFEVDFLRFNKMAGMIQLMASAGITKMLISMQKLDRFFQLQKPEENLEKP